MTTLVRRLLDVRLVVVLLVALAAAAVVLAESASASTSPSPAHAVSSRMGRSEGAPRQMRQVTDGGQPLIDIDYASGRQAVGTSNWDESAPYVGGSASAIMLGRPRYVALAPSASPSPTAQKSVSKASQLLALALVLAATAVAVLLLVRRHRAALRDDE